MNRYLFSQDYIAPQHIFVGDIYILKGSNIACKVTSVDGEIGYTMLECYPPEFIFINRQKFEDKFEFSHRDGELPFMQTDYDTYEDDYGYGQDLLEDDDDEGEN